MAGADPGQVSRITSYNVCYTKLLRGGDGIHTDIVVDGVHFMDTVERLLFHDLRLLDLPAAVENAVHVKVDAHPVRKCLLGVIGRGQRNPPDGRIVDRRQQADSYNFV